MTPLDPVTTSVTCPFCKRLHDGDVWATTDERVFTLTPLNPVVPGHRLFIPRKHIASATEDPWLAGITLQAAATYALVQAADCNLITSCGPAATQTVQHLHVHYVPRTKDDGLPLPWTPQQESQRV